MTAQLLRFPSNCEILTIEVDLMRDLVDDCHSFQAFSLQSRGDAHRAMRRLTITETDPDSGHSEKRIVALRLKTAFTFDGEARTYIHSCPTY